MASERVLIDAAPDAAVLPATPWYLTPMAAGVCVFVLALGFTVRDVRRRRVSRVFDTLLYLAYGLCGCVVAFLVFVSVHPATSPNWVILWLNPFCLLPTLFLWLKKGKNVLICYQILNFVVLLAMLALWPLIPQSANPAFLPFVAADMLRSASYVYVVSKQSVKSPSASSPKSES